MSLLGLDDNGRDAQCLSIGTSQKVTFTGTSAQLTAFGDSTDFVRVFPTQDCFLAVGLSPTATSASAFCPGGILQYFRVNPGQVMAHISDGTDGILYVLEGGQ